MCERNPFLILLVRQLSHEPFGKHRIRRTIRRTGPMQASRRARHRACLDRTICRSAAREPSGKTPGPPRTIRRSAASEPSGKCRRRIPGVADATPRVASMAASMASIVCGTWHMAALRASVHRQSHTSASTWTLVYVSGAPLFRMDMFLATPQLVATLYFLSPARPAASVLYFPAPHDQRRAEGGRKNIKILRGQRENRENEESERRDTGRPSEWTLT